MGYNIPTPGGGDDEDGSAGPTDHGALTGLVDDDHTQYHNNDRGDARYWALSTDLATQVELLAEATLARNGDNISSGTVADVRIASTIARLAALGTAAVVNTGTTSGTVPLLGASGVLAIGRLATGTPDGTKFVRDDGTLAAPPGGGSSFGFSTHVLYGG